MRPRTPVVLAATLVLALAAGPLAAPALAASTTTTTSSVHTRSAPDAHALRAAIAGLPDADATAALVRIGGTDGSWRGSAGVHDLASGRAADPDARFRAGSTTKVVTAAAVLKLAAQGKVDLNTPIQHYLPGLLTPAFEPVTVRQLLNHTSGIQPGDGWGDSFEQQYAHRFDTITPRQVVASAVAKGPEFAPGTRQDYLNINYTVLGMLIEKVTGHSYAEEATRLVLRPAGLWDTYFPGADPRIHGPHNNGYQAVKRADGTTEFVDVTDWNQADRWAAGDMISTTGDLERLVTALFEGRIVPRGPQLKEMFTVPAGIDGATYSAGLQRFTYQGRVYWLKSGARYGYGAVMAATRNLSRTLVYSVNSTDAKGETMNPVAERIAVAALK
ncbi:CubicO group peptidase (beta-lactamase class C family) [Streptomyces sp. LBL]|uniref:serine hydrolase domain-containing protein n=1 Tax=Streptomyces sp. LBL TaxID=2940562 RepID=UPI00247639FB|nr:serine hydrolase domain-containing protein [Streptomyces sp. LBL]MDH6624163.1 CubicO group peptidase (beta-lactamase class C family) [Streptomyces sp. LBL]